MSETRVSREKIHELYKKLSHLLKNNKGYLQFINLNIDKFNKANKDQWGKISILLEPLLRHEEESVRRAAAKALGKIGTSDQILLLEPLLKDDDEHVRSAVAEALGEIGSAKDIFLIEPLLSDENSGVQSAVAKALDKIGKLEHIPLLEPLLRDDKYWVRKSAAEAIENIYKRMEPKLQIPMTETT